MLNQKFTVLMDKNFYFDHQEMHNVSKLKVHIF